MSSLKENIEKNPIVWLLSIIVMGFLAGFSAYKTILVVSGQVTVSIEKKQDYEAAKAKISELEKRLKTLQSQNQYWLVLRKVEGNKGTMIRVEVTVNGINGAYPARGVWTEIGPNMSEQRFPIALVGDCIRVSFSAYFTYPGLVPVEEAVSQEIHNIKTISVPIDNKWYDLYKKSKKGVSSEPTIRIFYSIVKE